MEEGGGEKRMEYKEDKEKNKGPDKLAWRLP